MSKKFRLRILIEIWWLIRLVFANKNPVQIAQVTGDFMSGGLERVVLDIQEELNSRGLISRILVWGEVDPVYEDYVRQGKIVLLNRDRAELLKCLFQNRVSVAHFHHFTGFAGPVRTAGLTTVYTLHNLYTWLDYSAAKSVFKRISKFSKIVAVSDTVAKYASQRMQLYTRKRHIEVIQNGVKGLNPHVKTRFKLEANRNVIMVANFHRVKHYAHLAGLLQELRKKNSNLVFHVFGASEHSPDFTLLRTNLEIVGLESKVVFHGAVTNERVKRELSSGKYGIFLSISLQEGCSIALAEALAAGIPAVTTKTGDSESLASQSNSVLVVSNAYESIFELEPNLVNSLGLQSTCVNTAQLAEALIEVASNFDKYAVEAQTFRFRFQLERSIEKMVNRYLEVYYKK